MKHKDKEFLIGVAKLAAARSTGIRLKVGAVVSDSVGNFIAYGYNGSVSGGDNCLEYAVYPENNDDFCKIEYSRIDFQGFHYKLVSKPDVIHAEQNVISHAARRGISIFGGTMFITHSPCQHCTALMIQCGIVEVVYIEEYRLHNEVFNKYGNRIKFTQWDN